MSSCPDEGIRKIIIGAETEYGIFVSSPQKVYNISLVADTTINVMLDHARDLFENSFNGERGGIRDLEEHKKAEKIVRLSDEDEGDGVKDWFDSPQRIRRRGVLDPEDDDDDDEEEAVRRRARRGPSRESILQRRGITGLMLPNGSRFYQDMTHPELSTPEVLSPRDMVLYQKAGDRIVELCRRHAEGVLRKRFHDPALTLSIHKNNSDGRGNSYAAHENYALPGETYERICEPFGGYLRGLFSPFSIWRARERERVKYGLLASEATALFFIVRQIITGAGKVGSEIGESVPYQISSRADFFSEEASHETTHGRGIINLRDCPYANPKFSRRLHVIVGDGNISELSLYLKFGLTALFFMMLSDGFLARSNGIFTIPLADPVPALQSVSRDLTLREKISFINGEAKSALEVMEEFVSLADKFVGEKNLGNEWCDIVLKAKETLVGLGGARHTHPLAQKLDWVLKERLLLSLQKAKQIGPLHILCRTLALGYHDINPERSQFSRLEGRGKTFRLVREEEVEGAMTHPPRDTRAWLRTEIIRRYKEKIELVKWDEICFHHGEETSTLSIETPYWGSKEDVSRVFDGDPSFSEFLSRLRLVCGENVRIF